MKNITKKGNYIFSYDFGISAIGWSIIDSIKGEVVDMGVHKYNVAIDAKDPREKRSQRRTLRRKKWRKNQLKNLFVSEGLISKEDMDNPNFASFTYSGENLSRPSDATIYHLRKRALKEKVSLRDLFLALYHICGTRGHFLMEKINFDRENSINFDDFKNYFYELTEPFIRYNKAYKNEFEEEILQRLFEVGKIPNKEIKNAIRLDFVEDEDSQMALLSTVKLLSGFGSDLSEIDNELEIEGVDINKAKIDDLLKVDTLPNILNDFIELRDLGVIHRILKTHSYICEYNVEKLENAYKAMELASMTTETKDEEQAKEETNTEELSTSVNEEDKVDAKQKKKEAQKERNRVIRNSDNKFPNGLYVKEVKAILRTQRKYYPDLITDDFVEKCIAITKGRIPYYIGPMPKKKEQGKNAWIERNGTPFEYGYAYSMGDIVDEGKSVQNWKDSMRGHCTYLTDEFALPKGSFIAETFALLDELNFLTAIDLNDKPYYLTKEDKIKVFNELFLKNKEYTKYKEVAELLGLKYYGTQKKGRGIQFKTKYTLYFSIVELLPQYALHSILDIFNQREFESKVRRIEDIILNLNLFDEEMSKFNFFVQQGFTEEDAKKLSRMNSKGYYGLSERFIMQVPMTCDGETLLEAMFTDCNEECKKSQMEIICHAVNEFGVHVNYNANKYIKKFNQYGKDWDIQMLMQNGRNILPISRPVMRSLNECMKVYEKMIDVYGIPERIVIETARDLKDCERNGEVPAKHYKTMEMLHGSIGRMYKNSSYQKYIKEENCIESWKEIKPMLPKYKKQVELYIRQNGRDMITGQPISIQNIEDYEIAHILCGAGDHSMDNLMLVHKCVVGIKGDLLPLEYFESKTADSEKKKSIYLERCGELRNLQLISERKYTLLTLSTKEGMEDFINKNLVDTRYIIREFMAIVDAYNKVNGCSSIHVVSLRSAFTDTFRKAFNMRKNRKVGDQHHTHDAALLGVVDLMLTKRFPHYDERENEKYTKFLMELRTISRGESEMSENKKFSTRINYMYHDTFGHYADDPDSLISQIKNTVPCYYCKAEKKYTGQLFKETIYPQYDEKNHKMRDKGVLGILGVNNDTRNYSSVQCVAVDLYRVTTKKGARETVAIHIPKLIVDANGNINKEMYIQIIKKRNKCEELLDENGELNTKAFRLRFYPNDIMFDTKNKVMQVFKLGSIVKNKILMSPICIYSYNMIDQKTRFYKKELARQFDFYMSGINPNGNKHFRDYNPSEIVEFAVDNLMDIEDLGYYRASLIKELTKLAKKGNYQNLLDQMAYYELSIHSGYSPKSVTNEPNKGPTFLDTKDTKNNPEFVKVKTTDLGVRWRIDENGGLAISGPRYAENQFTIIKREKFTWNLKNEVLEK